MTKRYALFICLLVPELCFAQAVEVHECEGRWTNLPCDKVSTPANTRKVLTPEEAKARSQKESILHRLRMKNIEADRKYEVDLDISGAEELCNSASSRLQDCRKESERLEEKLDKKINTAALLKQREEKLREPAPPVAQPQTTVIIRDRYPMYRRPRYPYGYPYNSGSTNIGNGQVLQGGGQQIQQNVIIQRPSVPAPPPPTPQSSGSSFGTLR